MKLYHQRLSYTIMRQPSSKLTWKLFIKEEICLLFSDFIRFSLFGFSFWSNTYRPKLDFFTRLSVISFSYFNKLKLVLYQIFLKNGKFAQINTSCRNSLWISLLVAYEIMMERISDF